MTSFIVFKKTTPPIDNISHQMYHYIAQANIMSVLYYYKVRNWICKEKGRVNMFHLSDFVIYCFITAYTPGANNLLSMSHAMRLGFRRSIRFNFGILAGFFIVMTVCSTFSATLYSLLPRVKIVMQVLGAVYMLYLAYKVWKSSSDLKMEDRNEASFLSGMLLQFVNPTAPVPGIRR